MDSDDVAQYLVFFDDFSSEMALVNPDEVLIDEGNSGGLNMVVSTRFCSDGLHLTWWWFHSYSSVDEA